MGTRAIDHALSAIVNGAFMVLALGGFAYLFLTTSSVVAVTHLYWGLHLDALIEINDLMGIGHALVYALLAMMLARRTASASGWLAILVSLTAIGFGVECAQEIVGGRSFNLDDVLANVCGIMLGFLGVILAGPRFLRRR